MMPRVVDKAMTFRFRDFVRMNPPIFLVSKINEDPQEFLDGVYNALTTMGFTSMDKEELALYQLRDVSQILYTQWMDNRPESLGTIE